MFTFGIDKANIEEISIVFVSRQRQRQLVKVVVDRNLTQIGSSSFTYFVQYMYLQFIILVCAF